MAGPFLDFYLDPSKGFHFGMAFGMAYIEPPEHPDVDDKLGFFLSASVGYEFFIASQWIMGPILRLHFISDHDSFEWRHQVFYPSLLLGFTYH